MNRRIWLATVALATALGTGPPVQAAKLYKWVDEQGNVTYSQRKPPDRESETIRLRSATLDSSGAQGKLDELNGRVKAQQEDRDFVENSATATAERDERRGKNCETARENLRILKTSPRVQDKNADGESYFLDESGIQGKIVATQRQIDNNCS